MPLVRREKSTYVKGTAGGLLSVNAGSWKSFSVLCGEWRGRSILLPPAHTLVQLGVRPSLYFQAAMFTLSLFNSCHVCTGSACSTEYTFPETKLIIRLFWTPPWAVTATENILLYSHLTMTSRLCCRSSKTKRIDCRESYGSAKSTFEHCLALSDGIGSVIQSTDLTGQTHIQ